MMLVMFLKSIPVSPPWPANKHCFCCPRYWPFYLPSVYVFVVPASLPCPMSHVPAPCCWWWSLWSLAERWCSGSSAVCSLGDRGVMLWLHRSAPLPFSVLINMDNYSQGTGLEWQRHQFITLSQTMGMCSGLAQNFILHLLPSCLYMLRLSFWVEKSICWLLYLIFAACIAF